MVMLNFAVHCSSVQYGTVGWAAELSYGWTPCSVLARRLYARDQKATAVGYSPGGHQVLHRMKTIQAACLAAGPLSL